MSSLLELYEVHKYFEHRGDTLKVLRGVNLKVDSKDAIAITGASGSGKTTLLNIMGGLEYPTKGEVKFLDKNLYKIKEKELSFLRNREIGFIFQFHYLMPELNAIENVMIPALIGGYSKKEAYLMAIEVLEKLGLSKRLYHKPGELSGGEQQRVAIARAFIMKPKIILADEPTGSLDRKTALYIVDLLLELNDKEGVAIVMATHNIEIASKMKKRLELRDGVLFEL